VVHKDIHRVDMAKLFGFVVVEADRIVC